MRGGYSRNTAMSRRQRVISITLTALSSLAIAISLVYRFDTKPSGRIAATLALGGLCGLLMIAAVGLLIFRRTRWAGESLLCCAFSIPLLFGAGVRMSRSRGWIVWANSPAVEPLLKTAGPKAKAQVEANEIVYYKPGVTKTQMESFEQAVLYRPQPDGKGPQLGPGITYFRRLGPSQAHGHDGFAIGISPWMSNNARTRLRIALAESELVSGVLHDRTPEDVPLR
jgi:hypothetical protein